MTARRDPSCGAEIPAATRAAAARWFEGYLEDKYPGWTFRLRLKPEAQRRIQARAAERAQEIATDAEDPP